MKRAFIEFYGEVQGTGHRFFIKQKAHELGLKGFCQLNENNVLQVEVEGPLEAVDEFIRFVVKGVSLQVESNNFKLQTFESPKGYTTMTSDII